MKKLLEVLKKFRIDGIPLSAVSYGCGHINDTYLAETDSGNKYILQRINTYVFPDVEKLMDNIEGVTAYIAQKSESMGGDGENVLRVIKTLDGKSFYRNSEAGCFRVYNFIKNGISIETDATKKQLELSGEGFGKFQRLLSGYPADKLNETIKDFHNTEKRFADLEASAASDKCKRLDSCRAEYEFFISRKQYSGRVMNLIRSGEIPLRVTHNDTKINNVLIDTELNRAVAVIDLDTVMPGSLLYDFGDSIRSGANIGAEDETDLNKVGFSLELFDAYSKGFLPEVKDTLTPAELDLTAFGAILMTYECGMRFLTDYLEGDVYFKTKRANHNLDRARTQIKMVADMEKVLPKMQKIVKKYAGADADNMKKCSE